MANLQNNVKKLKDRVRPTNKRQLKLIIKYAFNHNIYNLNFIDTSEIKDMSHLFKYYPYNFDVSDWDVSNVTNMDKMFAECDNFDCDLSSWNVSKVKSMEHMFSGCVRFKGKGLENWDMSNVKSMYRTFF